MIAVPQASGPRLPFVGLYVDSQMLLTLYLVLGPVVVIRSLLPFPVGMVDLLAPFLVIYIWRRPYSLTDRPAVFYLLALVLMMPATIIQGGSPLELVRIGLIFGPFIVAYQTRGDARDRAISTLFYGGLIGASVTLGLVVLDIDLDGAQQRLYVPGQGSIVRAGGLLGNSGSVGHLVATWMTSAIFMSSHPSGKDFLYRRLPAGLVGSMTLMLSSSRTAFLHVLLAGAAYYAVRVASNRPTVKAVMTATARTLMGIVTVVIGLLLGRSLIGQDFAAHALSRLNPFNVGSSSTFYRSAGRLDSWAVVADDFWNLPFLGRGYSSWSGSRDSLLLDNSYLSVFVAGGILAGLAYALFWGSSFLRALHQVDHLRAGAVAVLVGQFVHGLFGDTLSMWYSMSIGFISLGLAIGPEDPGQENR